jgi:serine/threonine protein kinase
LWDGSFSHYRISEQIGSGGMGEAHDPRLKRDIALKVLPAEMIAGAEHRRRFQREAQAIAALNHPNIVTIHSVEEAEGVPFLTMELIEGKPAARPETVPLNPAPKST